MTALAKNTLWGSATAGFVAFILVSLALLLVYTPRVHLFPVGERIDLGDVRVGEASEKALTILNPNPTSIVLVGWSPTCHCMQAGFSQTVIPPGGYAEVYLRTTGTTPLGARVALVAIQWRFEGESLLRTDNLVVNARYVSPITLSKDRVDFSTVGWSQAPSESLLVTSGNMAGNWNGLQVLPASDRLTAKVSSNESGFQVQIQINPRGLPSGIWRSSLELFPIRNGSRTEKELSIPVTARIEGPFTVSPSVLHFFAQKNQNISFTLKIHSSAEAIRKLRILGNIVLKPTVTITDDGKDAIVTGVLPKPISNGLFVGKIPLQVNDGPEGSLQMPYIGNAG